MNVKNSNVERPHDDPSERSSHALNSADDDSHSNVSGARTMDSSMAERIENYPWHKTQLGSVSSWSPALGTAIELCLGSRMCGCIYWGADHRVIYNDAYASILGTKHPWALGRPAHEVWPEIFDVIGPLLAQTYGEGRTTGDDDAPIFINRSGYVEEFYCSFSYTPLTNQHGDIEGVFATLPETSVRVIGERRLRTLQELGVEARAARHPEQILEIAAKVFSKNLCDIPFASLYSWRDEATRATLKATSNIAVGLPLSPAEIDLEEESELAAGIRDAFINGYSVLPIGEQHQPTPTGAWKIPAKALLLLCFSPYGDQVPNALMVAGISPHKRLDEDHLEFFHMLAHQLERSLAEAISHEQQDDRLKEMQRRTRIEQQAERVRIARDLHDTVLQSMQGMRFLIEAGLTQTQLGKPNATELFEKALKASEHAIEEGRQVLSLLRSTAPKTSELLSALRELGSELAVSEGPTIEFDFLGEPRELAAEVWNEAYGICREAISNSVRHAEANKIEITLAFKTDFSMAIQDDGKGIEQHTAAKGREGHFGILGMRERAENLGATINIEAVRPQGTVVELIISAKRAYV